MQKYYCWSIFLVMFLFTHDNLHCQSLICFSGAVADCGKDPALFIDTPKEIKALNGSCLHIPCNFSAEPQKDFNGARITFGVWMKDTVDFANNPNDVVFNSSRKDNIYPMTLTGDLSQNNCTTSFSSLMTSYTGQYFFRVENKPLIATASCNPLQITVTGKRVLVCISQFGMLFFRVKSKISWI